MDFLTIKWVHIISSTILFGTGIGTAFFMFMANRRRDVASIYFATRHAVIADWCFTTPAVIVQFVSGMYLAEIGGYPLSAVWIKWALILYFFAGACWLPVVWLQVRMRNIAKAALDSETPLPASYWQLDRWWILLGTLAFPAVMIIFWLMVNKPAG